MRVPRNELGLLAARVLAPPGLAAVRRRLRGGR